MQLSSLEDSELKTEMEESMVSKVGQEIILREADRIVKGKIPSSRDGCKTLSTKNILRHEILGLNVVARGVKQKIEHSGEVVGETMKTIKLLKENGRIIALIKDAYIFEFTLPNNERVRVEGAALMGRPEDRLKRKVKRW
jgi:ribonuclease P protein subunit POP4